jgi:hypothetical protein
MATLERLIGSESAALAAKLARSAGWSPGELIERLTTTGSALVQESLELPKSRRQYLETAVSLQETLRRFDNLAQAQRELEKLEAELEAEAATLADGRTPTGTAVHRAQALLSEQAPEESPEMVAQRTACHWGLAALRLEQEVADADPESLDLALRLAAHELGARRASLHYKLFTYDHDNMVLQMRLGALTSRIAHLRADLRTAGNAVPPPPRP